MHNFCTQRKGTTVIEIQLRRCRVFVTILWLAAASVFASAAAMETFDSPPDPAKWTLSGSAAWDSTTQSIFLTAAGQYNSGGSIFLSQKRSAQKFTVSFDFWIGGGSGADGMTFAWVRGPALLGIGGGHLGFYGGLDGYGVKFDTYSGGGGEPENYVAIIEGTQAPTTTGFVYNDGIPEMEDVLDAAGKPAPFHVRIEFDSGRLEMWMSDPTAATPMLETKVLDYEIAGYAPYDAHFGFTAGTGYLMNTHRVDNVTIAAGAPTAVIAPDGSLTWEDFGNSEYTVQYTDELLNNPWQDVAGSWPSPNTYWLGEDISLVRQRFYRVMSQ
jgi:hypothetical protein